ncbi:MAG: DNA polymerase/3'-5' exonuclease PolX [Methanomassiliicoccales archaeon]|nr:DNA polymerase/3'-5' exonuclease PolX [Methanomassiliicoccales archaeon]
MVRNIEVAKILYEVADLLELQGVGFKPNAYRNAARNIESMTKELDDYRKTSNLRDIPGVGEAIAKKVEEILTTGRLRYLDELKQALPPGLLQLAEVPDLGPKTALHLYKELKITNLQELKAAAEQHRIRSLKGFGERSEERILHGISLIEKRSGRMLLGYAYPVAEKVREYVAEKANIKLISLGGSLRRMKETIGDIDILAGSNDVKQVMDAFTSYPEVAEVVERGPTKAVVRLKDGTQVDLRVVEEEAYGAALQYFTGSKDHNIKLRSLAIDKGWKLNEYGLFKKDLTEVVARRTEEDIYNALGLKIMPPELREDNGEIEASRKGTLPKLVELKDIKGDLHVHTTESDGKASMEELAWACKKRGYEYLGITDHSYSLRVTDGLSAERLRGNIDIARNVSKRVEGLKILVGAEVEIKEDGSLDYPDDVLRELDFVIGAVHSKFSMERDAMTDRVITAISNDFLTILAHPTGRKLEQREPYQVDLEKVMHAAKSAGVCLELNAFPERMDLGDVNCRMAKEIGVKLAIGTDSHSVPQLDYMFFGVATARRGWLEKGDVLNTLSLKELVNYLST